MHAYEHIHRTCKPDMHANTSQHARLAQATLSVQLYLYLSSSLSLSLSLSLQTYASLSLPAAAGFFIDFGIFFVAGAGLGDRGRRQGGRPAALLVGETISTVSGGTMRGGRAGGGPLTGGSRAAAGVAGEAILAGKHSGGGGHDGCFGVDGGGGIFGGGGTGIALHAATYWSENVASRNKLASLWRLNS